MTTVNLLICMNAKATPPPDNLGGHHHCNHIYSLQNYYHDVCFNIILENKIDAVKTPLHWTASHHYHILGLNWIELFLVLQLLLFQTRVTNLSKCTSLALILEIYKSILNSIDLFLYTNTTMLQGKLCIQLGKQFSLAPNWTLKLNSGFLI